MSIPVLNFQPYNPMDNLIQSALGVYGGINQGKQQEAQREMMQQQQALIAQQIQNAQAELPYIGKTKEAELARIAAQTNEALLNARKQKQILDIVRSKMPGMNNIDAGGMPGRQSQGMNSQSIESIPQTNQQGMPGQSLSLPINSQANSYAGSGALQSPMGTTGPRMQNNDPYPGPSYDEIMVNKFAGLPDMTPYQESQIKLWEKRQEKNLEREFPTSTTLTRQQRLTDIAPSWSRSLYEISEQYGNSPKKSLIGNQLSRVLPTSFNKKIENAGEATAIGKNFGTDAGGLHKAESIISPAVGESKAEYSGRLYQTLVDALPSIRESYASKGEGIPQEFFIYMEKLKENSQEGAEKSEAKEIYTIEHPDVIYTAQKYGKTPQQVVQDWNSKK